MSEPKPVPISDDELAEQVSLAALDFLSTAELAAIQAAYANEDWQAAYAAKLTTAAQSHAEPAEVLAAAG